MHRATKDTVIFVYYGVGCPQSLIKITGCGFIMIARRLKIFIMYLKVDILDIDGYCTAFTR